MIYKRAKCGQCGQFDDIAFTLKCFNEEKYLMHNNCAWDKRHEMSSTWNPCGKTYHVEPTHVSWFLQTDVQLLCKNHVPIQNLINYACIWSTLVRESYNWLSVVRLRLIPIQWWSMHVQHNDGKGYFILVNF